MWEGWSGLCKGSDGEGGGPKLSLSLEGHSSGLWALQYDDDKIVSGSADKTIRIWNFSTQQKDEKI